MDIDSQLGALSLHRYVRITDPNAESNNILTHNVLVASKEIENDKERKNKKTARGVAPHAQTVNKKISIFIQNQFLIEDQKDFFELL